MTSIDSSTHTVQYIPMMRYLRWLRLIYFPHTYTYINTHTEPLLSFLWMAVVFLAVRPFWRWKATWPFYPPLAETFDNTLTGLCRHTCMHARTHISTSNIPFHFLLGRSALAGTVFKHAQRQAHKWHLTCLNRSAIHSTTLLDVSWLVCIHVSVPSVL